MFNLEIQEKISEKIEYDLYLIKEYLFLYQKLLICFYNKQDIRKQLNKFIKEYLIHSYLEYQILIKIKKALYNKDLENLCIDMLEELERMFYKIFNFNEYLLSEYENAIIDNDFQYLLSLKCELEMLSKEKKEKFIYKLKKR